MSKVNVPFAVLSLVTSVLLWASVYNDRNDKPKQITINPSITTRGLKEKLFVITKIPETVSLPLSGYARDFRNLSQQSTTAIVDLENVKVGESDYPVIVFPSTVRELLGNAAPLVRIKIDKLITKRVDVIPVTVGSLIPGLRLGPIDTFPRWIYVTGPSESVEKVDAVQVMINLSGSDPIPQEIDLDPRPIDSNKRTVPNILMSATEDHPAYVYDFVENTIKIKTTIKFLTDEIPLPKK